MQCSNCGHQLTTGASFCGNCGVAVTHAQATPIQPQMHQQPAAASAPTPVAPPTPQYAQQQYPGVQPVQLHPSSRYNEMAIIAAIMLVIFPPVSAILGFIALGQIKQSHEQGRGVAIISIILGLLTILLFIAFVTLLIAFPESGNSYD